MGVSMLVDFLFCVVLLESCRICADYNVAR